MTRTTRYIYSLCYDRSLRPEGEEIHEGTAQLSGYPHTQEYRARSFFFFFFFFFWLLLLLLLFCVCFFRGEKRSKIGFLDLRFVL